MRTWPFVRLIHGICDMGFGIFGVCGMAQLVPVLYSIWISNLGGRCENLMNLLVGTRRWRFISKARVYFCCCWAFIIHRFADWPGWIITGTRYLRSARVQPWSSCTLWKHVFLLFLTTGLIYHFPFCTWLCCWLREADGSRKKNCRSLCLVNCSWSYQCVGSALYQHCLFWLDWRCCLLWFRRGCALFPQHYWFDVDGMDHGYDCQLPYPDTMMPAYWYNKKWMPTRYFIFILWLWLSSCSSW